MKAKYIASSIAGFALLSSPPWVTGLAHADSTSTAPSVVYVSAAGSDTTGAGTQVSPYATIGTALSKVAANGTVIVEPGTYKAMVTISQPVTLESDPTLPNAAANTIIDATGQDHAVLITSSDVTVQGLTLENAQQEGLLAAGKGALTNLTIRDNVVTNNALENPVPKGQDFEALHIMGVEDSVVEDNQVVNNKDGGLYLTDETAPNFGNIISGNKVNDNAVDCGITIASHVAGHGVYNNTISNNWSEGNGAAGIMLATPVPGGNVSNNTVTNNYVESNGLGGIGLHTHAPGSIVTGNTIVHNWVVFNKPDFGVTKVNTGIDVGASGSPITNTTIANNLIGYETDGINIQDSANVVLSGNWINPNVKNPVTRVPMPKLSARPQG